MVKFISFEDFDSSVITCSGLFTAGYATQMLFAPKLANKLYFEDHVSQVGVYTEWFGAALAMNAVGTLNQNSLGLTSKQKKGALKCLGAIHTASGALQLKQMYQNDFQIPIGVASVAIQASLAALCFARGFAKCNVNEESKPKS